MPFFTDAIILSLYIVSEHTCDPQEYTLEGREKREINELLEITREQQTFKVDVRPGSDRKCGYDGDFKPNQLILRKKEKSPPPPPHLWRD